MRILILFFALVFTLPVSAQTAVEGYQAYDAGDYEKAKSIIPPLAEQGDPIAMNAMGIFHDDGIIFEKNIMIACDWYEKAANSGYASAQSNFAYCFDESGGRKKSVKLMLEWFTKAAEQSNLNAQLELMFRYMETNLDLAKKWGEKAAAQNSSVARVSLWMKGLDNNIPPVKFIEIACVFYHNGLFDNGWSKCDY